MSKTKTNPKRAGSPPAQSNTDWQWSDPLHAVADDIERIKALVSKVLSHSPSYNDPMQSDVARFVILDALNKAFSGVDASRERLKKNLVSHWRESHRQAFTIPGWRLDFNEANRSGYVVPDGVVVRSNLQRVIMMPPSPPEATTQSH